MEIIKNKYPQLISKFSEYQKNDSVGNPKTFDFENFGKFSPTTLRYVKVLGDLIVHGMLASGGTDIDWLIEHNGGFVILEFKGLHNDKINIPKGQMIAYEKLHEKLNNVTKCYLYIIGCDDIDFSNPDASVWIFEMKQWKNNAIPKNTTDIYEENSGKQNKFIVYREYMEEIKVERLREIIDNHWNEFEKTMP